MEAWRFWWRRAWRRLWVRASLYGLLGVAAALVAAVFAPFMPRALSEPFGGGTVESLLNVLATSLLGVATFSTAAMLTAYTNVSQGATPRAAALITGDSHAQGALATFIGAFLYAVVAFSAIGTGYYGKGGRAIVFFVTLGVLGLVAISLLRWLDQLLTLARVGHAIDKVEAATRQAMRGAFGADAPAPHDDGAPEAAEAVTCDTIGYVQNVDVPALTALARECGVEIWVEAAPGAFLDGTRPLARVTGGCGPEVERRLRAAFALGDARSFDQDARFGLVVLGEIASRALSPAVNDPGTAIDVVGTAVRLLSEWNACREEPQRERGRVRLPRPDYAALLDDVFTPIARDGAGLVSVQMRLQKGLASLAHAAPPERRAALEAASADALQRAAAALSHPPDLERVRACALGR